MAEKQKIVIIGAGPVGALAAIYAAERGNDVEIYELRGGTLIVILPASHVRIVRSLQSSIRTTCTLVFIFAMLCQLRSL